MFNDGWLQNDFKDVSWNAWLQPFEDSKSSGMLGGPGLCGSINNEVMPARHLPLHWCQACAAAGDTVPLPAAALAIAESQ